MSTSTPATQAIPQALLLQLEALAVEHYKAERLDDAAEILDSLVRWAPENAELWLFLGVVHRRRNELGRSLAALERATTLDPENAEALIHFGEVLCKAGRPREGVALIRAVFDAGHNPALPPEAQDPLVIRAGACLEAIKEGLARWSEQNRVA